MYILLFQIFTCITDNLIPSFAMSPPDVESLRVYLTLPLYHGFANPLNYSCLQSPFSKSVLTLKPEALRVVGMWWSAAPAHYFERLVRIYKSIVFHFVKQPTADKVIDYRDRNYAQLTMCIRVPWKRKHILQSVVWNINLQYALDLLQLLYDLNDSAEIMRVPYETFHLLDLMSFIDIRTDYLKWLVEEATSGVGDSKLSTIPSIYT